MAGNGPAKSQDMRMTCSRAVAADGSDVARERDAVSIVCVKGLIRQVGSLRYVPTATKRQKGGEWRNEGERA